MSLLAIGAVNGGRNPYSATRTVTMGLAKLLFLALPNLPFLSAAPLHSSLHILKEKAKDPDDPGLWVYLGTAIALVLLGGMFAGLTIALMGQDEVYLQVIATSGEGAERKNAKRVLRLLKKGKHWVLVTLLLSNVITNETLPIVLDRSLGGGWPAVVASTGLIVIFGEVVPQSICVRFGLPIGAWCSPAVLTLMWIMSPIAWPTAKLLDYLLGEDHGTTYKKAGLKTLVGLHKTLGAHPNERLNEDEVTIISAVLDLKDKPIGNIMTPMEDVFTLSADAVLDEAMMDEILSAGYSRIPIHAPNSPKNFVGMLLVKMLITYDPEDCLRVRDFSLATLPETRPETSCLDIVNFFQEGKSHMVLVSDFPGEDFGALGVVTLEDVIEELIGEEIIDESDVFVDVHKAIKRIHPAPRSRVPKGAVVETAPAEEGLKDIKDQKDGSPDRDQSNSRSRSRKPSAVEFGTSPKPTTTLMRRKSSDPDPKGRPVAFRTATADIKQHLKHLGPSNAANKPKQTRFTQVKIKPGVEMIPETHVPDLSRGRSMSAGNGEQSAYQGGVGEGLISNAGREASDGVMALAQGYGTLTASPAVSRKSSNTKDFWQDSETAQNADVQRNGEESSASGLLGGSDAANDAKPAETTTEVSAPAEQSSNNFIPVNAPARRGSHSTIGSLKTDFSATPPRKRTTARSGSITESFVQGEGGVRKMVLETTSSSSDTEERKQGQASQGQSGAQGSQGQTSEGAKSKKKRKQRSKKKKNKGAEGADGENAPLLGGVALQQK